MIRRTAFLYADNGLVASTDPVWMQGTTHWTGKYEYKSCRGAYLGLGLDA